MYIGRVCPRYGKWGGFQWSGGEWNCDKATTKWGVPPIDEMDSLFKQHDFDMRHGIPYPHTNLCQHLTGIAPPEEIYGKVYRYACIGIFYLLSKFE